MADCDIAILGSGFRGLWLGTELVKLGWNVSWFQVHKITPSLKKDDFIFDDWPWQIGPKVEHSHFITALNDFIYDVLKPKEQAIAVQVVTPEGSLELSGPAKDLALKKFFPKTSKEIESFLECISKNKKELGSQASKLFARPLSERWVLEWLGGLRRSRTVNTAEWVLNWDGDILNPQSQFWLLEDTLKDVLERALTWAQARGVNVKRNAVVNDIGIEGRKATGVEVLGGEGFLNCKRIILACSHETALKTVPRFAKHISPFMKKDTEAFVWSRCGFYLKPQTKPQGLCEFSSFVIDPYMPLSGSNMGLLKWKVGGKGDSLTVWSRIPFSELKRRSYLMNLAEGLEKNLGTLFPWFSQRLVAVFPFEEYFHSPDVGHDDLAIVFDKVNKFKTPRSSLKNVTVMGPGADRGLELLSQLATEYRILSQLTEVRKKELKRDRALHTSRDGQNLVQPK